MSRTAIPPASVDALLELFERRGHERYGEDVTQLGHALQAAQLAQEAGAAEALVAAALLHDVGHLAADGRRRDERDDANDDRHEAIGARILAPIFGPGVAAPVALHVVAKRWRCAVDASYVDTLSAASAASLVAQGGPLDAAACAGFEACPPFREAVALRGWDDAAKDPDAAPGSLRDYAPLLTRVAAAHAASAGS